MTPDYVSCGICGRTWDDSIITSMTPVPSARCPFEYYHNGWHGEPVPDDYEVAPVCEDCHTPTPDRLRSGINRCVPCTTEWINA
jgi:hypothetical protein